MAKKYYAPVSPVAVATLEVFNVEGRQYAIGYRIDAGRYKYMTYGKARVFSTRPEAQKALESIAKAEKLKEVVEAAY